MTGNFVSLTISHPLLGNTSGFYLITVFSLLFLPIFSYAQCPGDCDITITPSSNMSIGLTIKDKKCCFNASSGNIVYSGNINLQSGGELVICGGTSNTVYLNGGFTEGLNGSRIFRVDGNVVMDDADNTAGFSKSTIIVNGSLTIQGRGTPTTAGITGTSELQVNSTGVVTINASSVNLASVFSIDGELNVNGNLTTSSGSVFSNTGRVEVSGNANFSGVYNNHGVWEIGQKLSLAGSASSNLTGGRFYSYDLELTSPTLIADPGGCAAFIVTNYSLLSSAGLNGIGDIGIWDLSNPGYIDNVNVTCAAGDAAPFNGGPYCGTVPITSLNGAGGCFAALPVVWAYVKVEKVYNDQLRIQWATLEEVDNVLFTVQRSYDGINYGDLINVEGSGSSVLTNHYSVFDEPDYTNHIYYRIKQTDKDGKFSYSSIKTFKIFEEDQLNFDILPNPAEAGIANLKLYFNGFSEKIELEIRIMDEMGIVLFTKSVVPENEIIPLVMNNEVNLNRGVYFVSAYSLNSNKLSGLRKKFIIN